MIKKIDTNRSWNWVDENNYMVGFDNDCMCCEDFGYKFYWKNGSEADIEPTLEDYSFTGNWMDGAPQGSKLELEESYSVYDANYASFEIKSKERLAWLTIYNIHNGYYSHGFEFKKDNEIIEQDYL